MTNVNENTPESNEIVSAPFDYDLTPTVKIGESVRYISTRGHVKLALVTANAETVTPGTSVPALSKGQLHLQIIPIVGHHSPRLSVPFAGTVMDNDDFKDSDGNLVGVWTFNN